MSNNRNDEIMAATYRRASRSSPAPTLAGLARHPEPFPPLQLRNTMLILLQCPEATRVAGFRAWQLLGRQVSKGEKAIWILAPVTRKATVDAHDSDVSTDSKARVLVAFKAGLRLRHRPDLRRGSPRGVHPSRWRW